MIMSKDTGNALVLKFNLYLVVVLDFWKDFRFRSRCIHFSDTIDYLYRRLFRTGTTLTTIL